MILVFGSAGYVAYHSERQKQLQRYYDIAPEATIVPPKSTNSTSNGSKIKSTTYTNTAYNFTFQYPENWSVHSTNTNYVRLTQDPDLQTEPFISINVLDNGKNLDIVNWSSKNLPPAMMSLEPSKMVVDGLDALVYSSNEGRVVLVAKSNYVYQISFANNGNNNITNAESVFNQILSTFKFTNQ